MSIEKYILTENSILQHFIEEVCDQNRILENRNKYLTKKVNELRLSIEALVLFEEELNEKIELMKKENGELKEIIKLLEKDKEEMTNFLNYQEKIIEFILK